MVIVETAVCTAQLLTWLTDEEYRRLQEVLVANPHAGVVIPGTGGLRKLRWARAGMGKRGGLRLIYYYYNERQRIYLLLIYAKNENDDLTSTQARILMRLVQQEFANG